MLCCLCIMLEFTILFMFLIIVVVSNAFLIVTFCDFVNDCVYILVYFEHFACKLCTVIEICTSEEKWNVCLFILRNGVGLSVITMFFSTHTEFWIVTYFVAIYKKFAILSALEFVSMFATFLCPELDLDHISSILLPVHLFASFCCFLGCLSVKQVLCHLLSLAVLVPV